MLIQNARRHAGEKTLRHIISDSIQQIGQNAKIAVAASSTTIGTGAATFLEWIPSDIGKLATIVGITLSTVLIYTHLKKEKRSREEHELKMEIMRRSIEE